MEIWTGFFVGLLGSVHCVGMCGPIAIALPILGETQLKILVGRVLYNFGRVIIYTLMGALFGLFGSRLILFGLQQNLSIMLGLIILIYILIPRKWKAKIFDTTFYKRIKTFLISRFAILISKKSISSLLFIGLLNGLLPCGFVYVGIAGASLTADWLHGAAYMALFGFGTFPIMLAASLLGKIINLNIRQRINKLIPSLTVILALLFILRGLNIGIPFVSPKFTMPASSHQQEVKCNH